MHPASTQTPVASVCSMPHTRRFGKREVFFDKIYVIDRMGEFWGRSAWLPGRWTGWAVWGEVGNLV